MTRDALALELAKCYNLISIIAERSETERWTYAIDDLKRCTIQEMPWWWVKKKANAITIGPRTIWVGKSWFRKDTPKKCRTLLHEHIHIRQYKEMGHKTFWATYLLSPKARRELEEDAYREGATWDNLYGRFRSKPF